MKHHPCSWEDVPAESLHILDGGGFIHRWVGVEDQSLYVRSAGCRECGVGFAIRVALCAVEAGCWPTRSVCGEGGVEQNS